MPLGRIVSSCAAATAAAGCAVLALAMSQGGSPSPTAQDSSSSAARTPSLVHATAAPVAPPTSSSASSSTAPTSRSATSTPRTSTSAAPTTSRVAATSPAPATSRAPAPPQKSRAPTSTQHRATTKPALTRGSHLPLGYSTGSATKVITVVAGSTGSTTATLQAWVKAPGGGWLRHSPALTAHVGSAGLTSHPSESRSATPMGSFTLTQAFGRKADPGTSLPYFTTTPADWWISQENSLYNTHQRCASNCSFTRGSPNEHLYYETPYYNYAVVIDYNTHNAPGGVRKGAGSAFFLHVTDGNATAGCVAISQSGLVSLMRWLNPGAHPRILIGVS